MQNLFTRAPISLNGTPTSTPGIQRYVVKYATAQRWQAPVIVTNLTSQFVNLFEYERREPDSLLDRRYHPSALNLVILAPRTASMPSYMRLSTRLQFWSGSTEAL